MTDHEIFMNQALEEARIALAANEFPVGCVLVASGRVIARGRRANSRTENRNELDHAEIMALRDLRDKHPEINPAEVTLYSTMEPCLMCYSTLILNGIRTIVYGYEDAMGGGTNLDLTRLTPLYNHMRVQIIPRVNRRQCLDLFMDYFLDPANEYWHGSLLYEYTLAQVQRSKP